ncbi:MAG: hypothetical protein MRERV_3c056 [Mycoplasmataceae bacterium RV_VA103A]|nr:MAG: hypothetical protein MRERV_3c056 [Mycoplasmataceae bacterium RV_VA103A]
MKIHNYWEDLDSDKWLVKTERGYTLVIIMELRRLIGASRPEFPEGYQFKIHAYNLVSPNNEFVRIDNHNNKPPHYHIDNQEKSFTWISWEESKKFFYQLACQRFGYFIWKY